MPKTVRNVYFKYLNYESIYEAYQRAKKHKNNKLEILKYEENIEKNLINIINDLKYGNYSIGRYKEFKVYEPKERIVKALPFKDRVIHQWYVYEFLISFIVPRFIYDSYACLKGKGTHKALKRLKEFMKNMRRECKDFYIIKMDIEKFFYNIDQEKLFCLIEKYINDEYIINLSSKLIFDKSKKGIPIGNYTSQYFANIYLNELDYYIKYTLKIKYYIRYMDDFILLVKDKEIAKNIFKSIKIFVENELKLKLNQKSRIYPSKMGVDFCGYRIFNTHVLIRNRCKNKIKKQIKKWNKLYDEGKLDYKRAELSINSWKGHISHANSYNLYKKYINKIKFDVPENH